MAVELSAAPTISTGINSILGSAVGVGLICRRQVNSRLEFIPCR
jgi:hypothetical protein